MFGVSLIELRDKYFLSLLFFCFFIHSFILSLILNIIITLVYVKVERFGFSFRAKQIIHRTGLGCRKPEVLLHRQTVYYHLSSCDKCISLFICYFSTSLSLD